MSLKLQSLTITRDGVFSQLVEGPHHCGPKALVVDGRMPIRYTLVTTCTPTLDARGFLFDQAMVQVWFERRANEPCALSCEVYVVTLANMLQDKIARNTPHCGLIGMTLTLSPAPHQASVAAHFIRTRE